MENSKIPGPSSLAVSHSEDFPESDLEHISHFKRECRILLVDDEEVIREIASEMLAELGFTCITAPDGVEGIRLYQDLRDSIALVILDVEMPGLTGDKVYDRLKEINPAVKILIASGYAKHHLESNYFKRKLDHYMPKPFQIQQLVQKLHLLLAS